MKLFRQLAVLFLCLCTVTACYRYGGDNDAERIRQIEEKAIADSVYENFHVSFSLNDNFLVLADSLWLLQYPFNDSLVVRKGDLLVTADLSVVSSSSTDSIWVKVARDQETIGWLQKDKLLDAVVPVDPVSQCIHWFSHSHTVPFILILGFFFLLSLLRALVKRKILLKGFHYVDKSLSVWLSWLLVVAATLYNVLQTYYPDIWERYYFHPSINPFGHFWPLGGFIGCVWLILLFSIAAVDDLLNQATFKVVVYYLFGLGSFCIFLYTFFTSVWCILAIFCCLLYTAVCIYWFFFSGRYLYVCGACGAKLRHKGRCPHCGTLNK